MHRAPPTITNHRITRLNAWAKLWLCWFVGVVAALWGEGTRAHPRTLDAVARGVARLIVVNVIARTRPVQKARYRPIEPRRFTLRAVIGARLRHALKGKDFAARLAAIVSVVRDAEDHIAHMIRRLRAGMTRLRVIDPKREDAEAVERVRSVCVLVADTS